MEKEVDLSLYGINFGDALGAQGSPVKCVTLLTACPGETKESTWFHWMKIEPQYDFPALSRYFHGDLRGSCRDNLTMK
jgi:hypothetical protein